MLYTSCMTKIGYDNSVVQQILVW